VNPKILFFTSILLLQCHFIFSQCISVELNVTWDEGVDIFKKETKSTIPKLNITYRNDCDKNYYFFKISPKNEDTPKLENCIISLHPMEIPPKKKKAKQETLLNLNHYLNSVVYTNQKFNVIIGIEPSIDIGWYITGDTIGSYNKNADFIGCPLKYIYEIINPGYNRDYESIYAEFVFSDMNLDSILFGFFNKLFVFLKAGETFTVSYNLLGFQMVEGCFTFMLDKNIIENFVTNFPKLDFPSITSYNHKKIKLPPIVGEYQLYSGAFNTNKVTVCFGEK